MNEKKTVHTIGRRTTETMKKVTSIRFPFFDAGYTAVLRRPRTKNSSLKFRVFWRSKKVPQFSKKFRITVQ